MIYKGKYTHLRGMNSSIYELGPWVSSRMGWEYQNTNWMRLRTDLLIWACPGQFASDMSDAEVPVRIFSPRLISLSSSAQKSWYA